MNQKIDDSDKFEILKQGLTANGKRVWESVIESPTINLERDAMLLVLLIDTFEEYKYLKSKVKKQAAGKRDPRIHENPNGTIQTHPLVQQIREARTDLSKFISQLGLSPLSAAKLNLLDNSDSLLIKEIMKEDR